MIFDISDGAKFAISMLHGAGYEAYAVGGCMRDMIMQRPVSDFDITTSATPEEMKRVFSGERVVETGIKHGTLTLVYNGENVEITTYRCDGEYKDSRHPSSVSFTTSLLEDLKRRDFTVNALAYDGNETLVDAFSGKSDIEKGIIRAIGDPSERFHEDALRILRGIRFSSVLGFEIEEKTKAAMIENLDLLDNISRERIAVEINKFVCGKYVKKAILENYEILGKIIPEVIKMNGFSQNTPYHVYDILTHTAVATQNVPPVKELRLAALFHDTGKVYSYT
ncbi:MAG: CCA tRNA nucleotidyltransferase, partial [Eubacteriales bacterium]